VEIDATQSLLVARDKPRWHWFFASLFGLAGVAQYLRLATMPNSAHVGLGLILLTISLVILRRHPYRLTLFHRASHKAEIFERGLHKRERVIPLSDISGATLESHSDGEGEQFWRIVLQTEGGKIPLSTWTNSRRELELAATMMQQWLTRPGVQTPRISPPST
jgi:hypothetical protein